MDMVESSSRHRLAETSLTHDRASELRLHHFLRWVVERPADHARWLNTLSLLEHIGSRKIIKAMDSNTLDETMLRHIAEEARHAYIFKRLSQRIMPHAHPTYATESLFAGEASKYYFQSLDHSTHTYLQSKGFDNTLLTYLCVTTLVEIRATQLYSIYEEILRAQNSVISLKAVLAEEGRHLEDMHAAFDQHRFDWGSHSTALGQMEAPLFTDWVEALETLRAASR